MRLEEKMLLRHYTEQIEQAAERGVETGKNLIAKARRLVPQINKLVRSERGLMASDATSDMRSLSSMNEAAILEWLNSTTHAEIAKFLDRYSKKQERVLNEFEAFLPDAKSLIQDIRGLKGYIAEMASLTTKAINEHEKTARGANALRSIELPKGVRKGVYFLQGNLSGTIKIGCSGDAPFRIAELRRMNGERLSIVGFIATPDYEKLERRIHQSFNFCHLHDEWFRPDPKLRNYVLFEVPLLSANFSDNQLPLGGL